MLEIALRLPPGALIGGDDCRLGEAVLRTGGTRFVAHEPALVRSNGGIIGWRASQLAVEAAAAAPNTGNSRFDAGPPGALVFVEGQNCGFTLSGAARKVEAFTVAAIYRSDGEAKTLASVFTGRANNMIFLTEGDGVLLAKDRQATLELSLPVPRGRGVKLALLGFDGHRLRLGLGAACTEAGGDIPGLAHRADFFIGCRSNRAGLAKTLGAWLLHELLFWPDRCLLGSDAADDLAALAALDRHVRWTY